MAHSREWSYQGAHGALTARTWSGPEAATHVVVIAHGYGEHIGRYEHVADALVGNGAVVYAVDPLVWHGPFKRPTLEALERGLADIAAGPGLGDLPLMWIHGEQDQLVPIGGSRAGIEHLRGRFFVERTYPEARHELFNELNADEVLAEVTAFIRAQLP
ncbi:alpha/beta hydrolase [Actinoplanes sp. NPDC024001]|uniref:alpha/beta hydrolase n=1 Tax=Actinoplanes sp. NPDC024001 TaxID=3154598 RepID=UPI003402F901